MEKENQDYRKLNEYLSRYHSEFDDDFNLKVMNVIEAGNNQVHNYDKIWLIGFRRLVIPAAADLVLLISYNLINYRSLTPEVINGNTLLLNNNTATLNILISEYNGSN